MLLGAMQQDVLKPGIALDRARSRNYGYLYVELRVRAATVLLAHSLALEGTNPDHSRGLLAAAVRALECGGSGGFGRLGMTVARLAGRVPWVPRAQGFPTTGRRDGLVLVSWCRAARRCAARPG